MIRSRVPLVFLFGLFIIDSSAAQVTAPRVVADIESGYEVDRGQRILGGLPTREGVVFAVYRLDSGVEIWGTADGFEPARRLVDACPLHGGDDSSAGFSPLLLARKGQVFFRGRCGSQSPLWLSDGTPAGTRLLNPAFEVISRSDVVGLVPGSEQAVFFGRHQGLGGLWALDGTSEPQRLGALSRLLTPLDEVQPSGSTAGGLVFAARFGTQQGLWVTDGTPAGTHPLASPLGLAATGSGLRFVPFGDRVLLTVGSELWVSDGTVSGTRRLVANEGGRGAGTIHAGLRRSFVTLVGADGSDECWVTDGTPAGTRRTSSCAEIVWGDRGYYSDQDQIWSFDGSAGPPTPVAGLPAGQWVLHHSSARFGLVAERILSGRRGELWILPEPAGTAKKVFDSESSLEQFFGEEGGNIFFADYARDDEGDLIARLWRSNGTIGGTTELVHGRFPYRPGQGIKGFSYFHDGAWWASSGDSLVYRFDDEALVVADIPSLERGSDPSALQVQAGALYFQVPARFFGGPKLYRVEAQNLVNLIPSGALQNSYRPTTQGVLYWTGEGPFDLWLHDEEGSHSLYRTRGSSFDFSSRPPSLVDSADGLLFADSDGLFRINPETSQVELVKSLTLGTFQVAPWFVKSGSKTFFFHQTGFDLEVGELWQTDGTTAGTSKLADQAGYFLGANSSRLLWFGVNGRMWTLPTAGGAPVLLASGPSPPRVTTPLALRDGFCLAFSREVWWSDGSEAGTRKLKDRVHPWRTDAALTPSPSTTLQDRCYFVAEDLETGHELWSTDGTVAGTRLVADLFPGPASSFPDGLTVIGDRLVFRASDGQHGTELWSTDGTAAGTRRHTDLAPGLASSDPANFVVWGSELAFVASDGGEIGREVWALPLTALGAGEPASPPAPGGDWLAASEVPGFRFKVRIGGTLGRLEASCLLETACISGALPGRPEVFLRMVGPKPNGFLWPTLVKFSTSEVEVWIEQIGLGTLRYYRLAGARPGLDELLALFDREGFWPPPGNSLAASVEAGGAEPPPPGQWVTTPAIPGFRFAVTLGGVPTRQESDCLAETLCASGAIPGRSEVFVRVVGPKPNGFLWPTLARFTTSEVEVWIEQVSTGARQHYRLEAAGPGRDDLTGLFDREGFLP